jgi:DNA-binding winged helix-turn-helix (wHTH) protein
VNQFVLGPLLIDSHQKIVTRNGDRVPLAHMPTGILILLLENAGTVVKRSTIRDTFWANSRVEEAVISRNISLIRTLLRLHLDGPDPIETISKLGYRLTGNTPTKPAPKLSHRSLQKAKKAASTLAFEMTSTN